MNSTGSSRAPHRTGYLARDLRRFATLHGGTLSVLLGGTLASAAARTPDAVAGKDGEGWVDFRPPRLDQYAADRARAWLEAAWRRAAVR